MSSRVDLYNTSYGNNELEVYREIRRETYGEDFGQTSWMTNEELAEIPLLLELTPDSHALEIGCGSGGCALQFAKKLGCRVIGLDLNPEGVRSASELAQAKGLTDRLTFKRHDVSRELPFADCTFDAVYSNDAMCHIANRPGVLREFVRVLKPGGRMVFSDALVVEGPLSNEEIAIRSSIGYYVFVPRGENERLIEQSGFHLLRVDDTTKNAALIAKRWHDTRERRRAAVVAIEGEANFQGLQRFLDCVYTLTNEKRLSRYLYIARKQA